jgi:hypothetical protein
MLVAFLAASWWAKLADMEPARLAHQVWLSDIDVMLHGCTNCWTYHLLKGLEEKGFISGNQWRSGAPGVTVDSVKSITITKEEVMQAALRYQAAHWQAVIAASNDPREAVSDGTHVGTHAAWVHEVDADIVHSRDNAPKFLHLCLPRGVLRCLGRYRLGTTWAGTGSAPPVWALTRARCRATRALMPTVQWQGVAARVASNYAD